MNYSVDKYKIDRSFRAISCPPSASARVEYGILTVPYMPPAYHHQYNVQCRMYITSGVHWKRPPKYRHIYNMSIVCNNLFHFDLCCVCVVVYVIVDVDVVSLVYIDIVLKTTAVALEIRSRYCTSSRIRAFLSYRSLHYFQFLNKFSAFKSIIFWTQSTQIHQRRYLWQLAPTSD